MSYRKPAKTSSSPDSFHLVPESLIREVSRPEYVATVEIQNRGFVVSRRRPHDIRLKVDQHIYIRATTTRGLTVVAMVDSPHAFAAFMEEYEQRLRDHRLLLVPTAVHNKVYQQVMPAEYQRYRRHRDSGWLQGDLAPRRHG